MAVWSPHRLDSYPLRPRRDLSVLLTHETSPSKYVAHHNDQLKALVLIWVADLSCKGTFERSTGRLRATSNMSDAYPAASFTLNGNYSLMASTTITKNFLLGLL